MKVLKIRDVKTPEIGTNLSAGIDFFIPNYSGEFIKDLKDKNAWMGEVINTGSSGVSAIQEEVIAVPPHKGINIPSGIKVKIDDNEVLVAFNKSGVTTKLGLQVGACVVDADYSGEVHLSLYNSTSKIVYVAYGRKIVQFLKLNYIKTIIKEVEHREYEKLFTESNRGCGGFGSTGEQ